jgi:hypothetical protein
MATPRFSEVYALQTERQYRRLSISKRRNFQSLTQTPMRAQLSVVISDERFDAVDLRKRKNRPVLILRRDENHVALERYGLRVEDIVAIVVHKLDAKRFKWFRCEEPAKPCPDHVCLKPRYAGCASINSTCSICSSQIQKGTSFPGPAYNRRFITAT